MLQAANFSQNCLFLRPSNGAEDRPETSQATSRLSSCSINDPWLPLRTKMNFVSPEPWCPPKPLWTKTQSIKIFLKAADCKVILPTNCIKKPGFLKDCAVCRKFRKCKNILALKSTKLKSLKESAALSGIAMTRLIRRLKNCLLKVEQHFHGLRSVPALLNKGYYCHQCNRGYNQENAEHHNCSRQNCDKSRRKNGKCPDYQERKSVRVFCKDCSQTFYGQNCFTAHKTKLCQRFKKCPECCKTYKFSKKKKRVWWISMPQLQKQSVAESSVLHTAPWNGL